MTAGASGCGRSGDDDQVRGKELFVQKCGSCHVLARAKTTGVQGPNLDEAFGPARAAGLGSSTVDGVVRSQIANVRRGSIMPRNLVKGDDAADVAAYVGSVAGQRGSDKGLLASAGAPKVSSKPVVAKSGVLMMPAVPSGALSYVSKAATAAPGSLTVESKNTSQVAHNIALKDASGKVLDTGATVKGGGVSKVSASVGPGKYQFLCTLPGHAAGGMRGKLTVK